MIRVRRLTQEHAAGARALESNVGAAATVLLVLVMLADFFSSGLRARPA